MTAGDGRGFRPEALSRNPEAIQSLVEEIGCSAVAVVREGRHPFFPDDGTDAEDLLGTAGQWLILTRGSGAAM